MHFLPSLLLVLATQQPNAKQIIQQAADAEKRLQSIQVTLDSSVGASKVYVKLTQKRADVPDAGFAPGKFHARGSIEGRPFEFGYDGKALRIRGEDSDVRVVDHPSPYEAGQQLPPEMVLGSMPHLSDFFQKLIKEGAGLTYVGQSTVGKWTCDVVEIKRTIEHPSAGKSVVTSTWSFDRESHLPVQRESSMGTVTTKALTLNPTIEDRIFGLMGRQVAANPLGPQTDKLLPLNSAAPDFSLRDPSGRMRSLREYRGQVVLLDFWGTWCLPCREAMPLLQSLHTKFGAKGLVVLGISVADKEADPAAFMKRQGFTYPILLAGDPVAASYKAIMLPTTYIVDRKGKIVFRQAGRNRDDATRLPKLIEDLTQTS